MSTSNATVESGFDPTAIDGKYLTFTLNQEDYGIGILAVREIIGIVPTTSIPGAPLYAKGVINLRGKVIPVIDMRLKFNLDEREYDEQTCIIVVEVSAPSSGTMEVGIIVDNVNEVLKFGASDIEPAPRLGESVNTDFILGIGKAKEQVTILLDTDKTLTESELSLLNEIA